jgi:predicted RNA methylase
LSEYKINLNGAIGLTSRSTGENSILSVRTAAGELGISPATLKNWIRLGKVAAERSGNSYVLSKKDVAKISRDLESRDLLRKRRNKRLSDSNFIPKSYIASDSPNYKTVIEMLNEAEASTLEPSDILIFYACRLMKERGLSDEIAAKLTAGFKVPCSKKGHKILSYDITYIPREDILGMLYISLRNLRSKKKTGSYYTPFFAVDLICDSPLFAEDIQGKKVCDPACGTGNFFVRLPDNIAPENIYGYDIDPVAVCIARINVALKYRVNNAATINKIIKNISCSDFLAVSSLKRFDIAIGNPPWGYDYNKKQSEKLRKAFKSAKSSGKPESFSLFIEKAMAVSERTAFLVPETLMESDTHYSIRSLILEKACVNAISYLGDIFDKVQCPCVILFISSDKKGRNTSVSFYKKKKQSLSVIKEFAVSTKRISSDSFQLLADDKEYALLKKMDSCRHFTLKDNAEFALGIVSGNNKGLIKETRAKGLEGLIRGTDIEKFSLKKPSSFIDFVPENLQQVAPERFYRTPGKLFYKFIAKEPVVAIDEQGYVSLNSANIILPTIEGYSSYYIMAVLNSRCISYYYRHTSNNMKVLRAKLESLPIPHCNEVKMQEISALSKALTASPKSLELRDELELKISELFGLDDKDFRAISNDN